MSEPNDLSKSDITKDNKKTWRLPFSWLAFLTGMGYGFIAVALSMIAMIATNAALNNGLTSEHSEVAQHLNTFGTRLAGVLVMLAFAVVAGVITPHFSNKERRYGYYYRTERVNLSLCSFWSVVAGVGGGTLLFFLLWGPITWVFLGTEGTLGTQTVFGTNLGELLIVFATGLPLVGVLISTGGTVIYQFMHRTRS